MNSQFHRRTFAPLPRIVQILLVEAGRQRRVRKISNELFFTYIERITEEVLEPRHLTLLVSHLPDGNTRFLIKRADTGEVCDTFECAPLAVVAY